METTQHLDPEVLLPELKNALRHGCRASRLMRYAHGLIDLLAPDRSVPAIERALCVEQLLREACASYGGDWGETMETLLGLAPGSHGALLKERRRRGGALLGVSTETFRRHAEAELLWDVAAALIMRGSNPEEPVPPSPTGDNE